RMCKEGKFVLLLSGPTFSGDAKTPALVPLLTIQNLRVWSHICMDMKTATEVVSVLSKRRQP
ncbi:MAG: hypothetical protein V3T77_07250, partial [Planctomycetota bacterium]